MSECRSDSEGMSERSCSPAPKACGAPGIGTLKREVSIFDAVSLASEVQHVNTSLTSWMSHSLRSGLISKRYSSRLRFATPQGPRLRKACALFS